MCILTLDSLLVDKGLGVKFRWNGVCDSIASTQPTDPPLNQCVLSLTVIVNFPCPQNRQLVALRDMVAQLRPLLRISWDMVAQLRPLPCILFVAQLALSLLLT